MNPFNFSLPLEIFFGKGELARLPEAAKNLKTEHAFIISDPGIKKMGIAGKCEDMLKAQGIKVSGFYDTEANPSVETVERAAEEYRKSGADTIVAVGGGSSIDVAKAAGVLVKYGGKITDYEGPDKVPGKIVPFIAIPTTAGTGSEVTASAVITDHKRNYKFTVFSYKQLPDYAILDPELITTAPASLAAACGIDAFIHAEESYISKAASPYSEAMSEKAMELIGRSIRRFVADRSDMAAAEDMLAGSLFAGIAFARARLGDVHSMSHPVSAYHNVPHGVANAIILPTVARFNAIVDNGKYIKIYNYISPEKADEESFKSDMLAEAFAKLNREIGIPSSLREVGVTDEFIEEMAEDAMKSGNTPVNPRETTKEDFISLYRECLG
ncbi:MAG: iron-containing alcohol dehydrogenase [Lachnospiraceae bacterium]|nr:iron-containing alcohol dehydrogenase [Lachnospiraceae bacterium]